MLRTMLACTVVVVLAYAAADRLTHGFQIWTAEGARRLETALNPVPPPRIAMAGPHIHGQTLQQVLAGKHTVTIVDFMYARCVTVCTALGTVFQQLQADFEQGVQAPGDAALQLLSISFDPAHDNSAALARYGESLRADPRVWRFAGVARASDLQALLQHYEIKVISDGLDGYEHNAALLVVDEEGRVVRVFDYAELDITIAYARSLAGLRVPLIPALP